MFSALDTQCLAVLHAATTASVGLVLRTNNPMKARQALYRVRKDFGTPEMQDLAIRASPDDANNELWLLRKSSSAVPSFNTISDGVANA